MPDALLATKLHIPRLRRDMVYRPRLMERLDSGLQGKLTLVSAPAGYGKTTAVCDWIETSGRVTPPVRAAWLSLDDADNDPVRFLTYVIAALQRIDESIGVDVQAALAESQGQPGKTLLTRLVHDIAAAAGGPSADLGRSRPSAGRRGKLAGTAEPHRGGQELVLVLDDFHLITSQAVHDALNFLLDHLPEAMHLLVSGRGDPPLPIARLRVQGEITEVRTPDLRFTHEEAAAFLNDLMGLGLSSGDVHALESRTEGWIASLQLAALSLRGRPDKREFVAAFSGSHRYVIDYLVDEVLSRQPEEIRSFLLQTSILDRFSAPLCDAVLGTSRTAPLGWEASAALRPLSPSQTILEQLERDNLFLVPLDDQRRWYRYHHLFADFLEQRLRHREPGQISELHRRASQWYEDEGLMESAIQHALTAGDMERATRLVDRIAALLVVRREPDKLLELVKLLPQELCEGYAMLCMWNAWALLFAGQLDEVEAVLQIAESQQGKAPHVPSPGYATTIRAYLANQRGNLQEAVDLTQKALEQLSDAPPGQTTLIFQGAAVIWLGVNYRHLGNLERAAELFVEAAALNRKAGNFYGALAALEQSADVAMIQGQLHRAAEIYQKGLELAQRWSEQEIRSRRPGMAASGLHLGLGIVHYQWNELVAAASQLQRAVDLHEMGELWAGLFSYRMLAYSKQAGGDLEAAHNLLCRACAIRDATIVRHRNVSTEPSLEQLRILLSRRGPQMAHLLADAAARVKAQGLQPDDSVDFASAAGYRHEPQYSDLARVLIALGQESEALPLLARLLEAAQAMGRQGDAIRYLVLRALAFQARGDETLALASLSQALALAEPERYVRIFVDEGAPMAALLAQAVSQGIARNYANRLLAAFPEQAQPAVASMPVAPVTRQPLVEPLTGRELEVLRLMASGSKHREIAEELVITLNTVRHHARNIYGKLDVNSRAQAILKASDLNLL